MTWKTHVLSRYLPTVALSGFVLCVATSAMAQESVQMTLPQAIDACASTPRMMAAKQSVVQAEAEIKGAKAVPNPSISIEGGMLPLTRKFTEDKPGGPTDISAGISLPIDWLVFGKYFAGLKTAQHGLALAQAEYADLLRLTVLETELAFFDVLEREALQKIASRTVRDLELTEEAIGKAVAEGERPTSELRRVRLALKAAKRDERHAKADVTAALSVLAGLIGYDGSLAGLKIDGSLEGPFTTVPLSIDDAMESAGENRPDILAMKMKTNMARAEHKAEKLNGWPEASIGLNVTHQFQEPIGTPDATGWGIGLEMSLPIGDHNQGGTARAASAIVQADEELRDALVRLHGEIEATTEALRTAYDNVQEIDGNEVIDATNMRDGILKAYEAGGLSYLDLLDAQTAFSETCADHIASKAGYFRALATYNATICRRLVP